VKAAFSHHFDQHPKAELVTQAPTHAQDDNSAVEVTAVEQPFDVFQLTHCGLVLLKTQA
jgi:hypothetical protein